MGKVDVQVNMYDKILKENMEASLGSIIHHTMGLQVVNSEEIPDDIQHTKERKPDVLKKVTDQYNNNYILHMELQSTNDWEMVYRMVEYRVMLQRKYRLPVKQYVLYIGKDKLTMITSITEEDFTFRYKMISLQDVDYKTFLQKDTPEERVLAILANFGEDSDEEAVIVILKAVKAVTTGELQEQKYIRQLILLSKSRKLNIKKDTFMLFASTNFTIEDDPYYTIASQKGKAEGITEGKKKIALELKRRGTDLTFIAEVTQLPIDEIERL